jgi:hypothetical protein
VVPVTLALIITILIAAVLLVALVAEETARREWHREADSWRKRACHHGGTSFQPYDGDDAARHGRSL